MSIIAMKKLVGIALSDERRDLFRELTRLGCVEISEPESADGLLRASLTADLENYEIRLAKLEFAREMIKAERLKAKKLVKDKEFDYKRDKLPAIRKKPEIAFDDFVNLNAREGEVFELIGKAEELNDELLELKAEEIKSKSVIDTLINYTDFKLKLNEYRDTKRIVIRMGQIPVKAVEAFQALENVYPSLIAECRIRDNTAGVLFAILREEWDGLNEDLQKIGFTELNTSHYSDTAENIVKSEQVNLKLIAERRRNITMTVAKECDTAEFNDKINLFRDYYSVEKQIAAAEESTLHTASAFLFEAWIPGSAEEIVKNSLDSSPLKLSYIIREPKENEEPPTLVESNAIVSPYQSITNMYSVPNSHEVDPSPFVTFFFILFFGMMLGDAGYGALIAIATGIYLAIAKPRRNELSLIKILFMGGISTIFWGVMFNSYFGLDIMPWELFKPLDEPMTFLILAIGLGLLQMLVGIAINAYSLFKKHKPLDAICGAFSWYAIVIGIALLALINNEGGKYAGIALLAAGLVMLMISGALHKRGAGKLTGAFGALYGLINFLSDLLSYSRLFGLGLATGVIAMVFNEMAAVFVGMNPYIGSVIAVVLIVVGHLFNIAINTLGAYVHNSRLQYVEFFNKFYTGEGRLFRPLGSEMKNYNFIQEETK